MSVHEATQARRAGERPSMTDGMSWSAGIINHGSYDDLERCLVAVSLQSLVPNSIVVYDTSEAPSRFEAMRLTHPNVIWQSGVNLGYAGGANQIIRTLEDAINPSQFFLLLNPDVALEPDYAQSIISAMVHRPRVAIATGKLLREDRITLDSAGITIPRNRRPRDRGSDQRDAGQFDSSEYVDAASGAAMMLRSSTLDDLRVDGELFDESFFAYHEDTDLCWRARLFGWKILYEPRSVAIHRREWQRSRRFEIPIETRRHSFKNHYLQIVKNEQPFRFVRILPWLLTWEILRLGFVLLRDRSVLPAYGAVWEHSGEAFRKRLLIQNKARTQSLLHRPG